MKEELTTLMHSEFMEGEMSRFDLMILSVFGAIRRGISKKEALKQHNITEDEYDTNIDRVLNS